MLVNLTPHPIAIYGPEHTLEEGPRDVIPPSGIVARLAMIELGTQPVGNGGYPYELVEYGQVHDLPPKVLGTDYIVSLVVALVAVHRDDLLAPFVEVRNAEGTMVGCRFLQKVC